MTLPAGASRVVGCADDLPWPAGRTSVGARGTRCHPRGRRGVIPIDCGAGTTTDSWGLDMRGMRACAITALALFALLPGVAAAKTKDGDQHVQVLAINDFHGNIQPPTGSSGRIPVGLNADGTVRNVDAGGVEYLKTWVDKLRAQPGHDTSYFVGAGDLIGASPLVSGLFHDEP